MDSALAGGYSLEEVKSMTYKQLVFTAFVLADREMTDLKRNALATRMGHWADKTEWAKFVKE